MGHLSAREYHELLGLKPLDEEDAPPLNRALTLQHLLACPRCRRQLTAVLLDLEPAGPLSVPTASPPAHLEAGLGLVLSEAALLDETLDETPAFSHNYAGEILLNAIERLKGQAEKGSGHPDAVRE